MLTVKQPTTYGYKTVHDLPTPPSTSRPSPPPSYHESSQRSLPPLGRSYSPPTQQMAAPHRGLPPPAAMTLSHAPPTTAQSHTHHLGQHGHAQPQPPSHPPQTHQTGQPWSALPAPPRDWQGAEDSMKNWLQAKTEEEKTKQEEERTRQETLRLEQRKIEADMLRASLGGGIPPPMVPLVFAGMGSGGVIPQAALDWAQQYFANGQATHHPQLMPPQGPVSPEHHREHSAHGQYPGQFPTSGSAPAPTQAASGYGTQPGSPTRARSQTMSTVMSRPGAGGAAMVGVNTNVAPGTNAGSNQLASAQADPSPSLFFHHWQPPSSQGGSGTSTNRPGTPSGDPPKKRKATGSQQPGDREQRLRSPPNLTNSSSSTSNAPAHRKGHKRQRSDMSWYRSSGGGPEQGHDDRAYNGSEVSPGQLPGPAPPQSRERSRSDAGKHSVSSLLSAEPGDQGSTQSYRHQHATSSSTSYYSAARSRPGSPIESKHRP